MSSLLQVVLYSFLTALCTGLGALPFLFKKDISKQWLGKANALAASLMIAASFGLIYEGLGSWEILKDNNEFGFTEFIYGLPTALLLVVFGVLFGLFFIRICEKKLQSYEHLSIENLHGAGAKKALLILGVMTLHSFAEGVAVGVSFGPSETFGVFMALALALHNIPEGLAISAVMVSRGVSWWKAGLWSIFSSLPQPLMAIPAFLFVQWFAPVLPVGLGFAAGAMIRMSFSELLPDAINDAKNDTVATIVTIGIISMIVFQYLISA